MQREAQRGGRGHRRREEGRQGARLDEPPLAGGGVQLPVLAEAAPEPLVLEKLRRWRCPPRRTRRGAGGAAPRPRRGRRGGKGCPAPSRGGSRPPARSGRAGRRRGRRSRGRARSASRSARCTRWSPARRTRSPGSGPARCAARRAPRAARRSSRRCRSRAGRRPRSAPPPPGARPPTPGRSGVVDPVHRLVLAAAAVADPRPAAVPGQHHQAVQAAIPGDQLVHHPREGGGGVVQGGAPPRLRAVKGGEPAAVDVGVGPRRQAAGPEPVAEEQAEGVEGHRGSGVRGGGAQAPCRPRRGVVDGPGSRAQADRGGGARPSTILGRRRSVPDRGPIRCRGAGVGPRRPTGGG